MNGLTERLDRVPPNLCRLVAHRGRRPQSNTDLAKLARLSRASIAKLSKMSSWRSVPSGTIERFSLACGVDILQPGRVRMKLRRRLAYMRNASPAQRRMYDRILKMLSGGSHNGAKAPSNAGVEA